MSLNEISPEVGRERFARARRAGYPAWLWPDVRREDWRLAVGALEDVARKVLAREPNPVLAGSNAIAMGLAGYTSGMGPLVGYWIERGVVQAEKAVLETFALHLSHNRRRMERLFLPARDVVERLAENGTSPMILKGMHTAHQYFPESGTRPLSDLDMYVPMPSMGTAERVLSALGYRRILRARDPYACDWILPSQRRSPCTLSFVHEDDPWSIDLLGSLDKRLPTGQRLTFGGLVRCCEDLEWFPGASGMRQPLLALYLAVHISQTLLNATLLRVFELASVCRHDDAAGKLDWDEFLCNAAVIGGVRFAYPALSFVEKLAPGTIPGHVMTAAAADAPQNLRVVIDRLSLSEAQPLDRHSVSERFMWAGTGREGLKQIATELFVDDQGRPLGSALYRIGSKLWALGRGRYAR